VPKQGTRTFFGLLRTFGVFGDEERRLKFGLGNDISPIVDADNYDPLPTYGISAVVGAVVGDFAFVSIEAPPTAALHIWSWFINTNGGDAFALCAPSLLSLDVTSASGITPMTGSGVPSRTVAISGQLNVDESVNHPSMDLDEDVQYQFGGTGGRGFVLGPDRLFVLGNPTANNAIVNSGILWTEVEQPPHGTA